MSDPSAATNGDWDPEDGCWRRTAASKEVLAEEYASKQICYRTTTPTAFHSALRQAFLAGYEARATRERT